MTYEDWITKGTEISTVNTYPIGWIDILRVEIQF